MPERHDVSILVLAIQNVTVVGGILVLCIVFVSPQLSQLPHSALGTRSEEESAALLLLVLQVQGRSATKFI